MTIHEIKIRRTKLFFDGGKDEAPAGTVYEFNIYDNKSFVAAYGNYPIVNHLMYAHRVIGGWNRRQPKNWKYEVV